MVMVELVAVEALAFRFRRGRLQCAERHQSRSQAHDRLLAHLTSPDLALWFGRAPQCGPAGLPRRLCRPPMRGEWRIRAARAVTWETGSEFDFFFRAAALDAVLA